MSVSIAVEKSTNFTEPRFWANYKTGCGEDEMADIVDFAFRSTNLSVVYVTAKNESNESDELVRMILEGGADALLKKVVPYGLNGIRITNAISSTSTAIVASNRVYSEQPLYTVYLSLSYQSWLVVLSNVLLVAALTSVFERRFHPGGQLAIKRLFFKHLFLNFGNLLNQGRDEFPRSRRGKFLFLSMILQFTFLFSFYNGNFQAGYAVPSGAQIDSFEDLLPNNIKILISTSSPSYHFFTRLCEEPPFESLKPRLEKIDFEDYEKMSENGSLVRNIENERLVVVDSVANLKDYVFSSSSRPRNLKLSDKSYFPSSVVFVLNRNISNHVLEVVNYRINQFVETRQIGPRQLALHLKIGFLAPERLAKVNPLNIKDLMPIFGLHLIGNSIAAILLLNEKLKVLRK